ncbi:hypothetical protein JW851_00995 [Candidatus Woesearchaeota archaeon]|nr:hypothetical protein [Candidatus Woesearchaeota archaeon]
MKKILVLITICLILLGCSAKEITKEETTQEIKPPEIELAPTAQEEMIIQEWAKTGPTVSGLDKISYIVWYVEWDVDYNLYNMWDNKGKHIGRIGKDKLILNIQKGETPVAQPAPVPKEIPVPLPTPEATPPTAPAPETTPPTAEVPPTPTPAPVPPAPGVTPPPAATPEPAYCSDGLWNGDESDVDCGGSCQKCPPPEHPDYLGCWDNNDCTSGNCDLGQAYPLPAIDPTTGTQYNTLEELRLLAGEMWIIPYAGTCS